MKIIQFRKLIHCVEMGEVPWGIICWAKQDWIMEDRDMGNGFRKTEVIQWRYFLRIDLWLFVLEWWWKLPRIKKYKK